VSGEPARLVLAVPGGYLLQTAGNTLDVSELEARVSEARGLGEAGRLSEAAEVLGAAVGAWQGTPLTGVPGPLAESERLRLTERRMSVLEARFDVDLKLGRHADVVSELTALCAEHPLREQLRALQMLALYRCGRQAEALVVFQEVRRRLVSERGGEPGAELRDLHARLLAADPLLAAKEQESVQAESPAVASTVPRQLPADLPGFTGRWEELARIQAMVPAADEPPAVVAVSGMAGVGKTALALRLAHTVVDRFPDGQLHLDLGGFGPAATVVEPEVAVRTFLGALGVFPAQIPEGLDAQVALYRSVLTRRRLLIVLDNATGSDHVRPLLPRTPGCLVVVTSRHQ